MRGEVAGAAPVRPAHVARGVRATHRGRCPGGGPPGVSGAAFARASRTADYQSASLAHYAAGGALSLLTHGLYKNFRNGVVTRGSPVFHPKVKVASKNGQPFQATVTDCANSADWTNYYKSGKPAPGERRGRQRVFAQLEPFDGVWKVTLLVVEKEGTC